METLKTFAEKMDDTVCMFVLVVLSYGGSGTVMCTDGKMVMLQEIVDQFSSQKCRALQGKPKLILVQACGAKFKGMFGITVLVTMFYTLIIGWHLSPCMHYSYTCRWRKQVYESHHLVGLHQNVCKVNYFYSFWQPAINLVSMCKISIKCRCSWQFSMCLNSQSAVIRTLMYIVLQGYLVTFSHSPSFMI